MTKPIAVLGNKIGETFTWIREEYQDKLEKINYRNRTVYLRDGRKLIVVTMEEHTYGMEFSACIKIPTYHTLEDEIRCRVR